jgi:hypothetical protein
MNSTGANAAVDTQVEPLTPVACQVRLTPHPTSPYEWREREEKISVQTPATGLRFSRDVGMIAAKEFSIVEMPCKSTSGAAVPAASRSRARP